VATSNTFNSAPRTSAARRSPASRTAGLWALALAAVATISALVATRHGPDIGPDGVTYVSAARNLVDGRGFSDFTGDALTNFPPGYSALLAAGELVSIDAFSVARVVNALTFGVIILLTFVLVRRHVESRWLVIGATAFIAFSVELLVIVDFVSTDPLFCALTLAFILVMEDIQAGRRHRGALIAGAAVLVWAAFMTRYAASSLLIAGVISVAAASAKEGLLVAGRRAVGFAALAAIVPGLWILRNATSGSPDVLGVRVETDDTPVSIVKSIGGAAKHLVFPGQRNVVAIAVVVVAGLAVGLLAWTVRRDLLARVSRNAASLFPAITFIVVYLVFVAASRKFAGAGIEPRILLAAWPATLVVAATLFEDLLTAGRDRHRALATALAVGLVGLVAVSVVWFGRKVEQGTNPFRAESSPSSAQIRRGLRQLPPSALVLSSDPWRVYGATRRQPVLYAPMEIRPGFSHRPERAGDVARALCTRPGFLLWFDSTPGTTLRSVRGLAGKGQLTVTRVRRVDGGTLYALGRTTRAPDCD
jgi:hypothetical protein